ncbi:phenylalanine--tRNA ligase subunit beta [Facklamia lactis]|uniref:phenylalanine--tRNA ligase subunit beta n=1 Tax=Facklamia lactis TaxID=2749967 RepID=UPI0018CD848C|nr:phenylalanine--tRNA ligase subunit beta [Facklamia lactis]MBG9981241.1 phenylalanine--tRNA ligase subunit beta [Facklamia lactis]
MYVSYNWLGEFLDLSQYSADDIAEKMSRTGIEIEGVDNLAQDIQGPLVVGQVVELHPHPDSDHLNLTKVDVGDGNLRQIVCGAPNVCQGAKVIAALEGTVLPGDILIKESELRGQVSQGMLCSLQEIGLSEKVVPKEFADGIMLLPEDAPIGASVIEYLDLDDPILELSITPNRADALSMRGTAFEVGAIIQQKPHFSHLAAKPDEVTALDWMKSVKVVQEESDLSSHYQLRLIRDVEIEASPINIQMRLMKANIRPMNNIVDATNYYMLYYGQPLHAFDYDALPSKTISIRNGYQGAKFQTLDEKERTLEEQDIVIAAEDEPIALAGIMGGLNSHVTDTTRNVLLEAAVFEGGAIRSASRRLGLRSEASARFEKGINQATVSEAGEQAALLIARLAGGRVEEAIAEIKVGDVESVQVQVKNEDIHNKLGIDLSQNDLQVIFDRLAFEVEFREDDFVISVPPRRWDIKIPADVLEEIARIYGYDNIPASLPSAPSRPAKLDERQIMIRACRHLAEGMGLTETVSYSLVSPEQAKLNESQPDKVTLLLPMSEDRSVLRQSMLPSMLEIARYNKARHNKPLAFYEIGKVFLTNEEKNKQPQETERLSLFVSGEKASARWDSGSLNYDFYDIKGMVEGILADLRLTAHIRFEATQDYEFMHLGRTAHILLDDEVIGLVGQLHPSLAEEYDLEECSYFAELEMDRLVRYQREELVQTALAKYPTTSRDLALLVDQTVSHHRLVTIIEQAGGKDLIRIELFDRYTGANIEAGKQSLAYHLTFQNPEKTLKDEEVKQSMDNILMALAQVEGLEVR